MTLAKIKLLGPAGPGALVWSDADVLSDWPGIVVDLWPQLANHGLPSGPWLQWLQTRLADLRISQAAQASMAQVSAVVDWLETAAKDVSRALDDGRLHRLPEWHGAPAVWHAAFKAGVEWKDLLGNGNHALIGEVLRAAAESLRGQCSRRGRPKATSRDALFNALVIELWCAGFPTVEQAGQVAAELLSCCKVHLPDDESFRRVRRRARRGAISVLPR